MPPGRHSDSTPNSRRVRLCSRLPYREVRTVQAAQPLSSVAASLLTVVTGDTRGHVTSVCTLDNSRSCSVGFVDSG